MPAETVKVSIVGCGAVSQLYYAPALKALSAEAKITVEAMFDPCEQNAEAVAAFFPNARTVSSLRELSQLGSQLAIVASPTAYHAEQVCELLRAGISVLCEKPMATNTEDAQAMIEQANDSHTVLAVGLVRRHFPAMQEIKRLVSGDILGRVRSFHFIEGGPFSWPAQSPALFDKAAAGGGVLLDVGAHLLDLVVWWLGEPAEVSYLDDAMGGLEANCTVELNFAEGINGQLRLSREAVFASGYEIELEKGRIGWKVAEPDSLSIEFADSNLVVDGKLSEKLLPESQATHPRPPFNFERCFKNQLLNVIAAISQEQELLVSGEEGIRGLKLAELCYKQRNLIDMPWLERAEFAKARQLNARPGK